MVNCFSMNMVKSRLLGRNTLSSTVIGVIPKDPNQNQEVSKCIHAIILSLSPPPPYSIPLVYITSLHPLPLFNNDN